jgi:ABC-type multidrug transport system ATPase subunit
LIITRLKEMLDLYEFSKTESQYLSGGNKRKLLIAIALIQGPRLVLFDEASAGLDPLSRRRVL